LLRVYILYLKRRIAYFIFIIKGCHIPFLTFGYRVHVKIVKQLRKQEKTKQKQAN